MNYNKVKTVNLFEVLENEDWVFFLITFYKYLKYNLFKLNFKINFI